MPPNPSANDGPQGLPPTEPAAAGRLALVEALLDAALAAQRAGSLDELLRQRPRAARWLARRFMGVVRGTAGDAMDGGDADRMAMAVLLRWLVTQLRPDGEPGFDGIDDEAWLNQPGWRPMLAVAGHAGMIRVPEFRERYRRRVDEAALDNLCGLWNVGPSTFYRYQERGKRLMALLLLEGPGSALRRFSLRRAALAAVAARSALDEEPARLAWHRRQIQRALGRHDPASALWHAWQAGEVSAFVEQLRAHASELAGEAETDALVDRVAATPLAERDAFDLWLARAVLARTRSAPERELQALDKAVQVARAADNRMLMGIAYGALGKFHEPRDAERAFACYQDSAEMLQGADPAQGDVLAIEHYLTTLARLAWLYVLRNDTRARAVLDRAEGLRARYRVPDDVLGMLEQTWGEYWRRAGEPARSIEHRFRALNIFERLGDRRSTLATYLNLVQVLGELRQFDRAIEYAGRILDEERRGPLEPELLASTHLNLGATYFWQGRLTEAIVEYQRALLGSLQAGLRLHAFRARYNLAEAHYSRYRDQGDAEDERLGDAFVQAALEAPATDSSPAAVDAARTLKAELLGAADDSGSQQTDRLLPDDDAVHFDEMAEIRRQREVLSVPGTPESHVRAHLAVANAYLKVSTRERELALALVQRHGLQADFADAFEQLRATFERELTREQQLATAWKPATDELLDDERRAALAKHLLREGAINKSAYAELCAVSPATASKHLGALAARGLLVQTGKGPSTRYQLAADN